MFSFYCKSFLFLLGKPFQRALSATQTIFIQAMQSNQASGEGNSGQQSIGRLVCSSSLDWLLYWFMKIKADWSTVASNFSLRCLMYFIGYAYNYIYNVKILDNKKRNQIHHYCTVFVTCTIKTMYPLVNELNISTMNELI